MHNNGLSNPVPNGPSQHPAEKTAPERAIRRQMRTWGKSTTGGGIRAMTRGYSGKPRRLGGLGGWPGVAEGVVPASNLLRLFFKGLAAEDLVGLLSNDVATVYPANSDAYNILRVVGACCIEKPSSDWNAAIGVRRRLKQNTNSSTQWRRCFALTPVVGPLEPSLEVREASVDARQQLGRILGVANRRRPVVGASRPACSRAAMSSVIWILDQMPSPRTGEIAVERALRRKLARQHPPGRPVRTRYNNAFNTSRNRVVRRRPPRLEAGRNGSIRANSAKVTSVALRWDRRTAIVMTSGSSPHWSWPFVPGRTWLSQPAGSAHFLLERALRSTGGSIDYGGSAPGRGGGGLLVQLHSWE